MNILELLKIKYPELTIGPECDIELADYGDGIVIQKWNKVDVTQPTKEQLGELMQDEDMLLKYEYSKNKIMNESIYLKLKEIDLESIRYLRINDVDKLTELENQAAELRAQLLPIK